ncbi:MAG: hypothetical protein HY791_03090 [Deltaproteobacteria bacterium]|nr:hypothetical protein [Deltaproteobacteria bacterium]
MNLQPVIRLVPRETHVERVRHMALCLHALEVAYHDDEVTELLPRGRQMTAGQRARWVRALREKLRELGVEAAPAPFECRTTSTIEAIRLRAQFERHLGHRFHSVSHCYWCQRRARGLASPDSSLEVTEPTTEFKLMPGEYLVGGPDDPLTRKFKVEP